MGDKAPHQQPAAYCVLPRVKWRSSPAAPVPARPSSAPVTSAAASGPALDTLQNADTLLAAVGRLPPITSSLSALRDPALAILVRQRFSMTAVGKT